MPAKTLKPKKSPEARKTCETCPLKDNPLVDQQITTEYFGKPGEIDVMFIAEGPGASENSLGRPFIGRTGRILRRLVSQVAGSQKGFAYGNVVRCRPTKVVDAETRDRAPTTREMRACRPNIWRDIKKLKPKAIVILGDSAAKGLAHYRNGDPIGLKDKVNALRGKDYVVRLPDGTEIPAVITYHFSYVFRTPSVASVFREDVAKVIRRVRGQIPDYSHRGEPTVMLDTVAKVRGFLKHLVTGLKKTDVVAFDYETTNLQRVGNKVLTVSFAYGPDKSYVIPLKHKETPFRSRDLKIVMKLLRKFFRTRKPSFKALVPHNQKFEELVTMDQFGTHILLPTADTQQRAHALNEDRKDAVNFAYSLKVLAPEHLAFYHYKDSDVGRVVKNIKEDHDQANTPLDALAEYNGMDAYVTWRLYMWQEAWAKAEHYYELFDQLSHKLHGNVAAFLAEMERNGLKADIETVRALYAPDSEIHARMAALLQELYALDSVKAANKILCEAKSINSSGLWGNQDRAPLWVFKIGAADAKKALFFDVLELKAVNKTKKEKKPSVDKAFYAKYEGVKEVDLYQEYFQLQKLLSTYIKGIHKFLHEDPDMKFDRRVRPHFKPTGTITGRISSANPNMLNIPSRSKAASAKAIKRLYMVDEGNVMICADYSQAEVRWLAETTQDPDLVRAFCDAYAAKKACRISPTAANKRASKLEGDFHRHTASMINNVPLADVTKTQRQASKAIVFGLVYGMTVEGLASRLGVSKQKAVQFIDAFFARFPVAQKWLDEMENVGFYKGRVLSPTGRRKLINSWLLVGGEKEDVAHLPRHLQKIKSYVNHEMRVCRNAPIQGVASDTNLLACSQLLHYVLTNELDWKIINTVYDSIMIEVPFQEAVHCIETAQQIMEDPRLFSSFGLAPKVPFAADFSIGVNWGDQFDITYDEEEWQVRCAACGHVRTEEKKPTNRRCEECGERQVSRSIITGPMDMLLKQLDRDHRFSELVA